eukprot:10790305-Karenia_brevis.AAC.1
MSASEGVPDVPPSPILSHEDPISPDTSFLDPLVGEGEKIGEVGGVEAGTQYDENMVAELVMSKKRSDEEIARIVSMVVQAVMPQIKGPRSSDRGEQSEQRSKVVLDEKHFRRMEKFSGDSS